MEVTKANFQELLPDIKEAIKDADFLSVDGEFTGLNYGNNITFYDTPEQYYAKLYSSALDFLFIQFGLAAFKEDPETKSYRCKVYNFYVFPKPLNRTAPDCRFVCQSSCLDFLSSNGFDFNKLFANGIPYLTQSNEESLKEAMSERRKYQIANNATSTPIPIPQQFKQQVDDACKKIRELLYADCTKEEIRIEKCSGFARKLIYQTVNERWSNKIMLETKQGVLVAKKRDKAPKSPEEQEEEAMERLKKEVDEAAGFSKVIRAISASEKLVVGHNMILDICHMIHQFCDPLPEQYLEFKEMVHFIFPKIIDTKFMCSMEPLKEVISSSVLEHLLQATGESPFQRPDIIMDENCPYNINSGKNHEAGYDAYVTGVCFLSLLKYIKSKKGLSESGLSGINPYINKLYLMRTPDTYIDLFKSDPVPCRDNVFFVTFPKAWTNQNLLQLFSPYGSIQIAWTNDTSAWVALFDKKQSRNAIKALCKSKANVPRGVEVKTYESQTHLDSAQPTKRKSETAPASGSSTKAASLPECLKRRKTSKNGYVALPVDSNPKKSVNASKKENCISSLEKEANSTSGTSAIFDVDNEWG